MRSWLLIIAILFITVVTAGAGVQAQGVSNGLVVVPDSSREKFSDIGRRAHTNHVLLAHPQLDGSVPLGLTPEEIREAYNLPAYSLGQSAGSQVIAIVDAYHYPTAVADFNAFSQAFGLPQETGSGTVLQVVYATGDEPSYNAGWSQESALDIQWAHAMAPSAKIVLVEAASNSFADLLDAVEVASAITV